MPFVTSTDRPFSQISSQQFFAGAGLVGPTGWLASNGTRCLVYAQNVGSGGSVHLSLNGSPAGTGNFNVLLKPPLTDMAGDGGSWSSSSYTGPIFASGASLSKFVLWESTN